MSICIDAEELQMCWYGCKVLRLWLKVRQLSVLGCEDVEVSKVLKMW